MDEHVDVVEARAVVPFPVGSSLTPIRFSVYFKPPSFLVPFVSFVVILPLLVIRVICAICGPKPLPVVRRPRSAAPFYP